MAIDISLDDGMFTIVLSGWDRVWAQRRNVQVPLHVIESVTLQARKPLVDQVAMRMRGSTIPGRVMAGSYSVWPHARVEKGDRQFWAVRWGDEVLVVDTTVGKPRRIVLQLDDQHGWMLRIQDAARAS